ncbi:hypothetical protein ACSBR1_020614 [Camellia fascicularis]
MGKEKPKSIGVWPAVKPFINGRASGMLATCVIQPTDMIKVSNFAMFQKTLGKSLPSEHFLLRGQLRRSKLMCKEISLWTLWSSSQKPGLM